MAHGNTGEASCLYARQGVIVNEGVRSLASRRSISEYTLESSAISFNSASISRDFRRRPDRQRFYRLRKIVKIAFELRLYIASNMVFLT